MKGWEEKKRRYGGERSKSGKVMVVVGGRVVLLVDSLPY